MVAVPPASEPEYINLIKNWITNYDLIIPTSEPEIKKIAELFEKDIPNTILILPSKIINIFLDKYLTYKYLVEHNFGPPKTKLLKEITEMDLPAYIKPRFGAGGEGNRVLYNKYDLLSAKYLPQEEWVAQELLTGQDNEITCAIFKCNDLIQTLQLRRELYGDRTGKAEVINDSAVRNILESLAHSLNFAGSLNVQLKITDTGPKIFEINPRISSTVMMRHKIGFKDCLWWVQAHLNLPMDPLPNIKNGTKIFRMSNECVFSPS